MSAPSAGRRQLPSAPDDSQRLSYSQNFITDKALVQRLLSRIKLGRASTIIEIGPGQGVLTFALARLAPRVIAVEVDTGLAGKLLSRFASTRRITLVHGDFLDYPLPACPFVVVANIPFNRTAEIVRKLTGEPSGLQAAYLVMQREAAWKYAGRTGCESQLLAHLLKLEYTVDYLCDVPRSCFTPRPSVGAAFALFRKRKVPVLGGDDARCFKDLLSCLHGASRPLLRDALRLVFSRRQVQEVGRSLNLDSGKKLGETAFSDWVEIYRTFSEYGSAAAHARIHGAHARLLKQQATLSKRHRTSVK
jgi:23S rRNA (adenine-N6)-dimethyltransferase